ncbi:MAG: Gfo/Idh/MocA family protein [Ferrimicrobium sp.]
MTSTSQLGIGVIGLGSTVAQVAVLPAIRRSSKAYLVGGYSHSPDTAHAVLEANEKHYKTIEDLLKDDSVDLVYLPVPNHLHLDLITTCLNADKHVMCEKPLALSLADHDRIQERMNQVGRIVTEAFMSSYHPRLRQVIEMVRSGSLGEVIAVNTSFTGTLSPLEGYRIVAAQGGGSLWDIGIYALHPIVELLGETPQSISTSVQPAYSPPIDLSLTAFLEYNNGQSACLTTSFVAGESQGLQILCSRSRVRIEHACTPGPHDTTIYVSDAHGQETRLDSVGADPYDAMIDEVSEAICEGYEPAWSLKRSRRLTQLLLKIEDNWRNKEPE